MSHLSNLARCQMKWELAERAELIPPMNATFSLFGHIAACIPGQHREGRL